MDTIRDEKLLHTHSHCVVSWSAVIAGALVAFSLGALLNLLNAGLGLVAFPETFRGLAGLTAGGYIWLIICGIVAMFIAGWVAGKIIHHYNSSCYGVLHGFLAWSLALLLSMFLAAHFASASAEALNKTTVENRADTSSILDHRNESQAERAADVAGTASIGIFFIFLLGAAAACLGGYVGAKNDHHTPDQTRTHTSKY